VNFLDEVELTAEQAFSAIAPLMGRKSDKCDEAINYNSEILNTLHLSITETIVQVRAKP